MAIIQNEKVFVLFRPYWQNNLFRLFVFYSKILDMFPCHFHHVIILSRFMLPLHEIAVPHVVDSQVIKGEG